MALPRNAVKMTVWIPDKHIDVTVQISDNVQTNFAQLLFNGQFRNQAEAITRARPFSTAYGAAGALNDDACDGNQRRHVRSAVKSISTAAACIQRLLERRRGLQ
jgi:hypothetical protein